MSQVNDAPEVSQYSDIVKEILTQTQPLLLETAEKVATAAAEKVIRSNKEKTAALEESRRKRSAAQISGEGNKIQYEVANEAVSSLEFAERALDEGNVKEAKKHIQKGKSILTKRMKLIRFADEEGWKAANEYSASRIASDDEDEKEMRKAVRRAQDKKEKMMKEARTISTQAKQGESSQVRKSSRNKTGEPRCYECGRAGHYRPQCFLLQSEKY